MVTIRVNIVNQREGVSAIKAIYTSTFNDSSFRLQIASNSSRNF